MQCKELEAVLEHEELSSLPSDAQEHLAGCAACQDMLADLSVIVDAAQHLPAEAEPPQRIWVSLRAQLEAEGIIHEPELVEAPAPFWHGFAQLLRPRALATVGVALLVVAGGAYVQQRRSANHSTANVAVVQPKVSETARNVASAPVQTPTVAPTTKREVVAQTVRPNAPSQPQPKESAAASLRPAPSEDAYFGESAATMNQMEGAVPTRELADNAEVDASFRDNLRTLNGFIAECEARLKKNPQDRLTREYLNMALQQKAELLTAMMDSGRSEN